jgi:anti-sigma-K factor RskA
MPPDLEPELGHVADAAGWALGALTPADAVAFQEHLPGCAECQRAVTDFQRVARVLKRPSPEIELPTDLEDRTITRVLQAAAAARQAQPEASQPRRQRARRTLRWPLGTWRGRLLTAASAVAAAAVAAVVIPLSLGGGSASPVAAQFSLQALTQTEAAWGQATVYHEPSGFKIVFHLHELPATRPGENYGAWYVGAKNGSGQARVITVGSFTVGRSGAANPTMWSTANPAKFPTMEITIDSSTGTAPGQRILVGHAAL